MLWSSGVLLLALAIFSIVVYSYLQRDMLRDVDRGLYAKANGVRTLLELENVTGPRLVEELSEFASEIPEGNLLQLSTAAGEMVWPSQPVFRRSFAAGLQTADSQRVLRMTFEYRGRPYEVTAAASLDQIRDFMTRLRWIMALMSLPMLLLAGGGGYWLSRRALAPVDAMTRAAQTISVESLSKRLPVPRTGDELARLAKSWNELLERLEDSVQRIQQFTADASHELRTPIALIRSTAELALRRERSAADYCTALAGIQSEAESMTELVESMLALARSDARSDTATMPLAAVDLNAVVRDSVSQCEILAGGKGVRLRTAAAAEPAVARANELGIRRLLRILLDNALEHTPAGGEVAVSVYRHNGAIGLEVRDTGEGIPPAALPHIFERFYRVEKSRGGKGAGLGLSIAQIIARGHGSEIEVESRPGEGSCFRIELKSA